MPIPILAAVRSPFAAADGVLAGWHPVDLAAVIAEAARAEAGIEAVAVDHVWVGCDEPVGAQGANMARALVLAAGWPETIGGTVVEAVPHSGMSALAAAVDAISAGRVATAMVVGVSSASIVVPGAAALARMYGRPWGDGPATRYADAGGLVPPIVAADRAAVALGIGRAAQESWGLRSIGRRTTPPDAIVTVRARPGNAVPVQKDTPIGDDVFRTIAIDELEPIFEPDGTTTAAGFAPPADGVSVLLLGAGDAIGEIVEMRITAGSPFDPGAPAAACASPDAAHGDRLDLAVGSASMALVALHAIGLDADGADLDGGTIAVGDAAAAEDLRLIVDGLHREGENAGGTALRLAPGAAAGCLWRRL